MVPIAPFGIYGFVAQVSKGVVALAYAIGAAGMIFTALSYARMSEAFPIAGSVYSYASRGINDTVGFFAGWAILLDYILVPSLLYVVSGVALSAFIPGVPIFVWAFLFIIINTVINIVGIEFTAKFNKIVLVFELIVLGLFIFFGIMVVATGKDGATLTFKPFFAPSKFSLSLVMGAVSIAVLSFFGFDGISTLLEETKGGIKSVGKATVISLLIVAALFMVQTWAAGMVVPDYTSLKNVNTAFYQVAQVAGGTWLMLLCSLATAFSWGIADSLVAQTAISRILYSMARDGNMPKPLAKVHQKFQTPYVATILVAVISIVISFAFSSKIDSLTSLVNFGALTSFLILHFSVIYYFTGKRKSKKIFSHLIFPLIGLFVIAYVWYSLDISAKILGFSWLGVGVVYFLILSFVLRKSSKLAV